LAESPAEQHTADEVRRQLRTFLVENSLVPIDAGSFADDLNIIEAGMVDSVLILDLVSYLEESFGIMLGANDIIAENFSSIDRLVGLVARSGGQRQD